jgi:hypothetical protein
MTRDVCRREMYVDERCATAKKQEETRGKLASLLADGNDFRIYGNAKASA